MRPPAHTMESGEAIDDAMIDVTVGRPDTVLLGLACVCMWPRKRDKHAHDLATGQVARLGNLRVDGDGDKIWRQKICLCPSTRLRETLASRALPKLRIYAWQYAVSWTWSNSKESLNTSGPHGSTVAVGLMNE